MSRPRKLQTPFRIVVLSIVITLGAAVLGVLGHGIWCFIMEFGISGMILCAIAFVFPLLFIAFCFADMVSFLLDPRIAKRKRLPDSIEIDEESLEESASQPRHKRFRLVTPMRWFYSRWAGPGGYR